MFLKLYINIKLLNYIYEKTKTDDASEIIMDKLVSLKDTNWSKLDTDKLDQLRKQQQDFKKEIDDIMEKLEIESMPHPDDYMPDSKIYGLIHDESLQNLLHFFRCTS